MTWVLGLGLFPLVLLLFPDGRLPTRRWRPLAWLTAALAVALPLEGGVSLWLRPPHQDAEPSMLPSPATARSPVVDQQPS